MFVGSVQMISCLESQSNFQMFPLFSNLIPKAHMPFGQHQDTELCNNEQSRSQSPHAFCFQNVILLFLQIQISTFLVFPVCFECLCVMYPHQLYLWTPCNPRHACAMKLKLLKSWTLEINYSRAPCLGADQKACGLWKRAWLFSVLSISFEVDLPTGKVGSSLLGANFLGGLGACPPPQKILKFRCLKMLFSTFSRQYLDLKNNQN